MKLRNITFLFLFFLNFQVLNAQLNVGGFPKSFNSELKIKSENSIPKIIILPELNNEKLRREAEKNDVKDRPWQFGKNISVNIDLKKNALTEKIPGGKLYRLKIISKNALTLNFRFKKYKLPQGAVLYLYNSGKKEILGGFTFANNQKNGIFATSLIKGDEIILEYYEPDNSGFSGELVIDRVTHGFRGAGEMNKGFGNSGDCNLNVACDDGTFADEIRSVCMLVTGGSGFCSGALINNTQEDGTPYILTANHCYEDPSDMVFWFNWQSATCENPSSSPAYDALSGAVLRARDYESDFCLFELNDVPPYTYNVYYAGWNNEDVPSSASVCVHHPSADIKKISYDDDAPVSDYYLGNSSAAESHWKVVWDRNTTTEGGSSGSPLFNQNGKITGQLHGGYASCTNQTEPDWYGKFSYSWDTGTTPETRLKDWLDPLNLNITEIEGYDPNIPLADNDAQILKINSPQKYYFGENSFLPSVKIRNRGNNNLTSLKISYQIDNSGIVSENWTGNIVSGEIFDFNFEKITLPFAKHTIKFWTELPNGVPDEYVYNDTIEMTFFIYENIFFDDFEEGNVWELSGEFQIGNPQGLGGEKGNADPAQAFSGNRILGTDLSGLGQHPGDYENNISYDKEYAVSPVIDCRNYENCLLTFKRQLGIDMHKYDRAEIDIKTDTSDWTNIWANTNVITADSVWTSQNIDISEYADGNKILIRFSLGPTDHADQYCGWNIDDFTVAGTEIENPEIPEKQIFIYPNPGNDYFYIEFLNNESFSFADVTVSDLSGKTVFEKRFSENEIKNVETSTYGRQLLKINLRKNNTGMFLVNVKTDRNEFSGKVILIPEKE